MTRRRPERSSFFGGLVRRANPLAFAAGFWRYREALVEFTRLEFASRYHGAMLGVLWGLLTPLMTLAVYAFVFSVVFKPSWAGVENQGFLDYALILFTGIIVFEIFAGCVNRTPRLISENVNFVKKVVFPLEILPVSILFSVVLESFMSLVLVVAGYALTKGTIHATLIYVPLAYLPLIMLTMGVCWFLSSIGVFLRDVGNVIAVLVQLFFFATPIIYPLSAVPEKYRWLLSLNPMAAIIDAFRRAILWGQAPDWASLGLVTLAAALVMLAGYAWFMNIKKVFADVL